MKPAKLVILCTVLALAGCGDKDDADSAKSEGSLLDQAKEMTSNAADSANQAVTDAGAAVSGAADSVQEGAADAADQAGAAMDSGVAAAGDAATAADAASAAADTAAEAGQPAGADAMAAAGDAGAAAAETAKDAASGAMETVTPAAGGETGAGADLAQGKTVYEGKCQACHATGAAGAPKLGDKANWAPRIAQGMDTLVKHALEGFKGSVGYMPPKGGFTALSDDEVRAAVAYMVSQNP